jgi:hypothetical protein
MIHETLDIQSNFRRTIRFFIVLLGLLSSEFLKAKEDSLSVTNERRFIVYSEILGHNYSGFSSTWETGIVSINVGYRQKLISSKCYLLFSGGWGIYKSRYFQQSIGYSDGLVNFIPLEGSFQIGRRRHFFEIGFSVTLAYGKQNFIYERPSGGGPWYEVFVLKKEAIQFIPRLGYCYYGNKGLFARAAITPHFYPGHYDQYGIYSIVKPQWISLGTSIGWALK